MSDLNFTCCSAAETGGPIDRLADTGLLCEKMRAPPSCQRDCERPGKCASGMSFCLYLILRWTKPLAAHEHSLCELPRDVVCVGSRILQRRHRVAVS